MLDSLSDPFGPSRLPKSSGGRGLPCPASARATTASADSLRRAAARRPFRREAGSPRVRTLALVARPPNLRGESLVSGASRSLARSPQLAPPHIGFLCVGPRLREELPSDGSLPPRPCSIALGSLRPAFLSPASAHAGRTNCRGSLGSAELQGFWRAPRGTDILTALVDRDLGAHIRDRGTHVMQLGGAE